MSENTNSQDVTEQMANWIDTENAENKSKVQELKDMLMPVLKELGITKITLTYSGSGDSGNVEMGSVFIGEEQYAPKYEDGGTRLRHIKTEAIFDPGVAIKGFVTEQTFNHDTSQWDKNKIEKKFSIEELAVDIGYYAVEAEYMGWELNDGSDGTIEILPDKNLVRIEHTQYETTSETTEAEL